VGACNCTNKAKTTDPPFQYRSAHDFLLVVAHKKLVVSPVSSIASLFCSRLEPRIHPVTTFSHLACVRGISVVDPWKYTDTKKRGPTRCVLILNIVALATTKKIMILTCRSKIIQIFHYAGVHWVVVSTFNLFVYSF